MAFRAGVGNGGLREGVGARGGIMAVTEEGTNTSAQRTEVIAKLLARRPTAKQGKREVCIFFNSWYVCIGLAIWSSKWKTTNRQMNAKTFGQGRHGRK